MPDHTLSKLRDQLTPTIGLKEAAALLRCHPDTVRKMAKARELPGTKVGRSWVFYSESLLAWLKARCESKSTPEASLTSGSALAERLRLARLKREGRN